MSLPDQDSPSTRPYLIRALHEWCVDNGFSPYIAVQVDGSVKVPMEFVHLGNEFIEFKARFGGVAREIVVPIDHVVAIYARENGQGMAFPAPAAGSFAGLPSAEAVLAPVRSEDADRANLRAVPSDQTAEAKSAATDEPPPRGPNQGGGRPTLKRVK